MSTVGDNIRPLFPGITLPDDAEIDVLAERPVGPIGGEVREALLRVYPGITLADDARICVLTNPRRLGDSVSQEALLDDDFTSGTPNPANWSIVQGNPTIRDGDLVISNAYPRAEMRWAGGSFDPRGRTATILGLRPGWGSNSDADKARYFQIRDESYPPNMLAWMLNNTDLWTMSSSSGYEKIATFNPALHANLRIRETAGNVLWESSADGVTWGVRRTVVAPEWLSTRRGLLVLQMGANSAGQSDPNTENLIGRIILT